MRTIRSISYAVLTVLGIAVLLTGCTTIGTQEMSYLGEEVQKGRVSGSATHTDFAGIGVDADSYIEVYDKAMEDAFRHAPKNTSRLTSVKAFKEYDYTSQIAGMALVGLSASAIAADGEISLLSAVMYAGGVLMTMMNSYDFVVIGTPEP
ncbi:MAG: hypothetical protein K9M84_08340 [Spirochaetia bacterium]|nr:hypothetical protein [Spirochaetia bacterium]MCF7941608.1 hypothetical protein [Spirochaetia bacterium]